MVGMILMLVVVVACIVIGVVIGAKADDSGIASFLLMFIGAFAGVILSIPVAGAQYLVAWCFEDQIAANTVIESQVMEVNGIYIEDTDNGTKIVWADSDDKEHRISKHAIENHDSNRWEVEITTTKVTNGWEWLAPEWETTDYVFYVPTKALYGNE